MIYLFSVKMIDILILGGMLINILFLSVYEKIIMA